MAWHTFFGLIKGDKGIPDRHKREASQVLPKQRIKQEKFSGPEKALIGLQRIYQSSQAKPRSEGQASALALVHNPSPTRPLIIVLPTSSGKSALFFSVAAMTQQQTVIVVVPFAALVDDIIRRGEAAQLDCEEWVDTTSGHELRQLIVVSADRAATEEFLHYAKGLELQGQLAQVFFDEVHVTITDTSYRERLRQLWQLRYLECPFTGLTATLMVALEDTLKERLCIPNALVFRRSTNRRTVQYTVKDSKDQPPSDVAMRYIEQTYLPSNKRGIIYVRSYETGRMISRELECPFYKARGDNKGEILQQWIHGPGGWIVATGALGTGVNIEGIFIHIGRPYGLTSFIQQSGRGGRQGEISYSTIITRVKYSSGWKRSSIMSEYSVEAEDEQAMTEFIQSQGCRREVIGFQMDGEIEIDCMKTDSVFCDQCQARKVMNAAIPAVASREATSQTVPSQLSGPECIDQQLQGVAASQEQLMRVMEQLQGGCIYCQLKFEGRQESHEYQQCTRAAEDECSWVDFQVWRKTADLGQHKHCYKCGLSQKICRRMEDDGWCEFPNVMLPGIFILHQRQQLAGVVDVVGFQGDYDQDVWEWMKEMQEGFGVEWESNWMGTWRMICRVWEKMVSR